MPSIWGKLCYLYNYNWNIYNQMSIGTHSKAISQVSLEKGNIS